MGEAELEIKVVCPTSTTSWGLICGVFAEYTKTTELILTKWIEESPPVKISSSGNFVDISLFSEQITHNQAPCRAYLQESIVSNYNKYKDRGYMPIYARESVKKIYEAYTDLGGNDVAHDLYEMMRHWNTDPEEREEVKEHE